jgi:hypothetical protein
MTKVVFLAERMEKPLLLDGPAGSGKTRDLHLPGLYSLLWAAHQ